MQSRVYFSRFRPVRVRVHPTWYLAAVLVTGILVTQYPGSHALWELIVLGLVGSLFFLLSMAAVAALVLVAGMLARVEVRNLTIFVFGGVAVVPEDGTSPRYETWSAILTLLFNFVVAGIFNWIYVAQAGNSDSLFVPMLQWLAFFWYMLAILHVLPAFPLAVGRIVASGIWKSSGNYLRAVRWSGRIGFFIGLAIGALGVVRLLGTSGQTTNGLLLLFVGLALSGAAVTSMRRGALLHALKHTTARNIMSTDFPTIVPSSSLNEVVRSRVLTNGQDYFAVADGDALLGIVTIRDIQRVPMDLWESTRAEMVMEPPRRFGSVSGDQSAAIVLEEMDRLRADRIPVVETGSMIGIVSRDGILRLARAKARLKM